MTCEINAIIPASSVVDSQRKEISEIEQSGQGASQPAAAPVVKAKRLVMDHNPYWYSGYGAENSAKCRVRVFAAPRKEGDPAPEMVVIVTELPDNPGTSVTNAMPQIATLLLPELIPNPDYRRFVSFVEHYPANETGKQDTFDAVGFAAYDKFGPYWARNLWGSGFSGTYWHRIARGELTVMLGAEVEL
jgi:hypothetical protein